MSMTSDERMMLAAVLANPVDDLPRLVYADALEETGDAAKVARAAFIRVQVEAARLAAAVGSACHPPNDWCDCNRCRCERRAVLLFDGFRPAWFDYPYQPIRNYTRGFLAVATYRLETLRGLLPGMLESEPIERVQVSDVRPVQINSSDSPMERWVFHWTWPTSASLRVPIELLDQMPRSWFSSRDEAFAALNETILAEAREYLATFGNPVSHP